MAATTAYMTIVVRVASSAAEAKMTKMTGQVAAVEAASTKAAAAAGTIGSGAALQRLGKWGNQLQWAGRQLTYNFTLPLAAAGVAATKWALDNEKAFVRVQKVYGDTFAAAKQFRKENSNLTQQMAEQKATRIFAAELDALQKAFRALSDRYGVAQKDVIDIAAAWAAAGQSGVALAKSTELTIKAVILGVDDSAKATEALIAIQAQYGLSTNQLSEALAYMNAIENQTGISLEGLIDGFQRAAGVARDAGIDIRHLGALLAALTPATGSAAQAGNALKTIISRLVSPTDEAKDVMAAMGINIDSLAWKSANGVERLEMMSKSFNNLSQNEQNTVASTIASRWQINKFSQLMDELLPKVSYYEKALDVTSSRTKAFAIMQKELNAVLSSSPQQLQQVWVILQNALADIITPMIPYIIYLARVIASLVMAFSNLDPALQKFILWGLALIAIGGPLLSLFGAFVNGVSLLGRAFIFVAGPIAEFIGGMSAVEGAVSGLGVVFRALPGFIFGPWGAAIAAAISVLIYFRDDVARIFRDLVDYAIKAFYALPQSVQNAMIATVEVVKQAALAIYGWFQYLNPFAEHSPSLVTNVHNGMESIKKDFHGLRSVRGDIAAANNAIAEFNRNAKNIIMGAERIQRAQDMAEIRKVDPGAIASYLRLQNVLQSLERTLARLQARMNAQQRVVDMWQNKVDQATNAIERQQQKLDHLNDVLSNYQDKLSEAQADLDYFANAPLKGMDAMEDKIFRNEMAQKRLRLEYMKMEDAVGTLDELGQKINEINGAQELLTGERSALRQAGAGSEILSQYDDELGKLDKQKDKYQESADKLEEMSLKLDQLQRQAEKLDLVKALKFDVLQHKIDEMVNSQKELTFEQIVNGIKKAKHEVAFYTHHVDQASAAVDHQQKVVDRLTKHRDRLQNRLDKETDTLDKIRDRYDKVNDAIQNISTSLDEVTQAAESMNQALQKKALASSKGPLSKKDAAALTPKEVKDLLGGKGAFPEVGGAGIPLRKDWSSQVPQIEKFTQRLANQTAKMFEDINPFAALKEKARSALISIKNMVVNSVDWIGDHIGSALRGIKLPSLGGGPGFFSSIKDSLGGLGGTIKESAGPFFGELGKTFSNVGYAFTHAFDKIAPEIKKFKEVLAPAGSAIKDFATVAKPVLRDFATGLIKVLGLLIKIIFKVATVILKVFNNVWKPVFNAIVDITVGAIESIRGGFRIFFNIIGLVINVIKGVVSLFRGDWSQAAKHFGDAFGNLGQIFKGVKEIFEGTLDVIIGLIKGFINTAKALFWTIVHGVVDIFKWLWDKLVGHSIIPDMIDAIIACFGLLIDPIKTVFSKIWDVIQWVWGKIKPVWEATIQFIKQRWIPAFKLLWSKVADFFGKIWDKVDWLWDKVEPIWAAIIKFIKERWIPAAKLLWEKIKDFFGKIWDKVDWLWDKIEPVWAATVKFIKEKWIPAAKLLWEKFKEFLGKIWDKVDWLWDKVKPVWDAIVKFIRDKLIPAAQDLWGKLRDIWDKIWGKIHDVWTQHIKPVFDDLKEAVRNIPNAFEDARKGIGKVWDAVKKTVGSPIYYALKFAWNPLAGALHKIPGVPDWSANIENIPHWRKGGYTRQGADNKIAGFVHSNEFVVNAKSTREIDRHNPGFLDRLNRTGLPGHKGGGLVNPMKRVYVDGEPLTAVHAAQLLIAGNLMGTHQYVVQGSWQAPTSYSGTSHTGPGVADTTPGNFRAQYVQRRAGIAAWGRNFPGAHYAGSGAHVHGVSQFSAPGNSQLADFYAGGDGLGGRDYGPRPARLPNLLQKLKRFGDLTALSYAAGAIGLSPGGFDSAMDRVTAWPKFVKALADAWDVLHKMEKRAGLYPMMSKAMGSSFDEVKDYAKDKIKDALGFIIEPSKAIFAQVGENAVDVWNSIKDIDIPGIKEGGVVMRRPGGTIVRVGEGRHDEAIIPLDNYRSDRRGGREVHFHGDLSFPNITDPNDAERFIRNLESLARGGDAA